MNVLLFCYLMSENLLSGRKAIFQERCWPHVACWSGMPIQQRPMPNQNSLRSATLTSSWLVHPADARCWRLKHSRRWATPMSSTWPAASMNGASKASQSSRVWDCHSWVQVINQRFNGEVTVVQFIPGQPVLALGFEYGEIQLWDYQRSLLLASLIQHRERITDLATMHDGHK